MQNSASTDRRKGFFHYKKIVDSLGLPRPLRAVLIAILTLCPNGDTTTARVPVTYERIQEETGYSRSHVIALVGELQETPYLRVRKQPYTREDGRKWNRANVYELLLPEEIAQERPKKTPKLPKAPEPCLPPSKPQEEPQAHEEPALQWPEPEPGECETHVAEASTWEPDPDYVPFLPVVDEPAPVPEPVIELEPVTSTVQPQSPEGFSEREQAMADVIAEKARAVLTEPLQDDRTRAKAINGWLAIIAARYALGRDAIRIMGEYGIGLKEIDAAISEWARKAVMDRPEPPLRQAMRLRRFFLEKGKSVDRMRRNKLGIG